MTEVMTGQSVSRYDYLREIQYRVVRNMDGMSWSDTEKMDLEDLLYCYERLRAEVEQRKDKGGRVPEARGTSWIQAAPEVDA